MFKLNVVINRSLWTNCWVAAVLYPVISDRPQQLARHEFSDLWIRSRARLWSIVREDFAEWRHQHESRRLSRFTSWFLGYGSTGRIHEGLEGGQEEGLELVIESIRADVAYELCSQNISINELLHLLLPSIIEHRPCLVSLLRRGYWTLRVDPIKPLCPLPKILRQL